MESRVRDWEIVTFRTRCNFPSVHLLREPKRCTGGGGNWIQTGRDEWPLGSASVQYSTEDGDALHGLGRAWSAGLYL